MRELLIALAAIAAMFGMASLPKVPWRTLMQVGGALIALGFAFGIPTAVVYHVRLYKALKAKDELPDDWIWRPIKLHDRLEGGERRHVLPWAYAGGAGFVLIVIGLVVAGVGVLFMNRQ